MTTAMDCHCDEQRQTQITHRDGRIEWECAGCRNRTFMGYSFKLEPTDPVFRRSAPRRESLYRRAVKWFFAPLVDETELDRAIREEDERRTKRAVLFFAVFALTLAAGFLLFAAVCP